MVGLVGNKKQSAYQCYISNTGILTIIHKQMRTANFTYFTILHFLLCFTTQQQPILSSHVNNTELDSILQQIEAIIEDKKSIVSKRSEILGKIDKTHDQILKDQAEILGLKIKVLYYFREYYGKKMECQGLKGTLNLTNIVQLDNNKCLNSPISQQAYNIFNLYNRFQSTKTLQQHSTQALQTQSLFIQDISETRNNIIDIFEYLKWRSKTIAENYNTQCNKRLQFVTSSSQNNLTCHQFKEDMEQIQSIKDRVRQWSVFMEELLQKEKIIGARIGEEQKSGGKVLVATSTEIVIKQSMMRPRVDECQKLMEASRKDLQQKLRQLKKRSEKIKDRKEQIERGLQDLEKVYKELEQKTIRLLELVSLYQKQSMQV